MIHIEYSTSIYKSSNINIATVMRNEKLKCIPGDLKTKTCISMQLKNYLI